MVVEAEVANALRRSNNCLVGSPYLFPEDEAGLQRLEEIGKSLIEIQHHLDKMSRISDLPKPLKRILRVREIFESNAIEGVGPDVKVTTEILDSKQVDENTSASFVEWALTQGIRNDGRVYAVIGLAAARDLSRAFATDVNRPITETDIRGLHKIIMDDDSRAGIYKPYPNSIAGNDQHETALPTDTPARMEEFCKWMNGLGRQGFQTLDSIVKAAAVHGWLAHIHPFDDGNGRVARLLANLVLAREGYPPLILRHKGDRERYIDALAYSDEAGDISRLVLIFCRSIQRVLEEMSDPKTAQEYFEADIDLRLSGEFKHWKSYVGEWTDNFLAQLRLVNMRAEKVGDLEPSDFSQLRKLKPASRAWYMKIYPIGSDEVSGLIYFGYMPSWTTTKLNKDQQYPCLLFLVPDSDPKALRPFIAPKNAGRKLITGLMIEPNEKIAYIWGDSFRGIRGDSIEDSAKLMAITCLDYAVEPSGLK